MNKRITDPTVPYIGPIDKGNFCPGKMISINGFTPSTTYRFNINLQCGPETTPQTDVALQVAVHVLDGYISVNSLQNEILGEEQRGALLIKRSTKFEVVLICDVDRYKVAIDGQHYCDFPQRIHYDCIKYLTINGDVSIYQILYESVSRRESGGASGSRVGQVLQSSAPIFLMENDEDEFEIVTNIATAPNLEMHPLLVSDSSAPPSYKAALNATRPPHPICDPMGTPLRTGVPRGNDNLPYPQASTSAVPSPAPVSLNMDSSNVKSHISDDKGSCLNVCGFIIAIIIFSLILQLFGFTKKRKNWL